MKLNNYKQFLVPVVVFMLNINMVSGQSSTVDSARNIAVSFFSTYDSLQYLSFDVRYSLFSDTVYSDFSYETIKGTYTLNGKKARYQLGDVEYLQNDSFLLAVYHKDQQIIVSQPPAQPAARNIPLRETLDSLLSSYTANYDIWVKSTITGSDSTGYIRLVRKTGDTAAAYNRYVIEYNIIQNLITRVEFEYTEPGQGLTPEEEPDEGQRLLKGMDRRKTLRIEFTGYRFDHFDDSYYNENQFIWKDEGEYKPVEKFRNYQVFDARG